MSHDLRISARTETQNKFKIEGGSKLEVFDEDGKLLHKGEFKSFTSNFLKLLYGSMIGAGTAKAKDLTNADLEMDSFPQNTFNVAGGAGVKKFGVVVGTNTAAVSVSDYNITVPASLTVNDTVVSASSVGADSISVEISRQIGNSSGSAVNLKETGLICGSEDEVDSNVLIARDLLDITLENGKKSIWRYTINFNFANDAGGFVKAFADNIFGSFFSQITSSADWSARCEFGCVVFQNKIWVMGGRGADASTCYADVWNTSDGITWSRVTSSAGWTARYGFGCVVFQNKIWVMGGRAGYNGQADVWNTSDGITWSRVTSSVGWMARFNFGCVVYQNKIWVMGGYQGSNYNTPLNDVWNTSDGITWSRVTSSAGWSPAVMFPVVAYNDYMWVFIGHSVWQSANGNEWNLVSSSGFAPNSSLIFDDMIVLVGYGRVKYSLDQIIWTTFFSNFSPLKKSNFGCVVYQNKIWVMGGLLSNVPTQDVLASREYPSVIVSIKPGSSDSAFSVTGTALGALIADGSESGQLVYGTMPSAATQEPFVSGNKTKFSIAREFTNNSGADITVREVGLFSGSDMLARLILANPVTIANGQSDVITVDFETEV